MKRPRRLVLTVNAGSSSLKAAVFELGRIPVRRLTLRVDRIGLGHPTLEAEDLRLGKTVRESVQAPDHRRAGALLAGWLERTGMPDLTAVGHRMVHGGPHLHAPTFVTPSVLRRLRSYRPFDPEHLPAALNLVEEFRHRMPSTPQIVCFDTAFHHDLPRPARLVPLPRGLEARGVRRYGFHGLSYAYLLEELARIAGAGAARGRVVLAHLGNGASLAAVHRGRSVETTMGFSPAGGLPMGTRSGDLDPGLVEYLTRRERWSMDRFNEIIHRRSGLLGLSGTSPDVRDLLAREARDSRAADALAVFCHQTRKGIGAMAAAANGLDTLVFAGGIGENSPEMRARICRGLEFLGVALSPHANFRNADLISAPDSRVSVRVIRTDEERMMAREVHRLLENRNQKSSPS